MMSRLMDVIWAFPVFLLAICVATVLLAQGLSRSGDIVPSSFWMPTLIIGIVYIPYVCGPFAARSSRCAEKEFVEAAVARARRTGA